MEDLLLSPQTRRHLKAIVAEPSHAILLVGPTGMGKKTVATRLAQQLGQMTLVEADEKNTISIETVRSLYPQTRSRHAERQVIVVDHAEGMGTEAQNAFLKLLEEPRAGVTFILTAPSDQSLLQTITSRVQSIQLPKISQPVIQEFLAKKNVELQPQELAQLLFVTDGRPGRLVTLLEDTDAFSHYKQLMTKAKEMLGASQYKRLAAVGELAKNKDDAVVLLEAMSRMLHLQILRDPSNYWLNIAEGVQLCLARLAQNGNPRAQLTALFMGY